VADVDWAGIHRPDQSWRTKLIGDLSSDYVMPRYVALFEKYLRRPGRFSFLELGAGNGEMAKRILEKKFDFVSRYAVSENFPEGVVWLKEKGLEAIQADAQNLPFEDGAFDVVHCFDVMHHVDDPRKMAREMLRTARGRLFLTESNGLSVGRKLMELTPAHRRAGERSYTPGQYRSFFNCAGFRIVHFEIHPFVFPLYLPAYFSGMVKSFNQWIEGVPLLNWQCSNVYIYIEYEKV